ncbi:retrovirus-related pol polyprotein from transposon TNT 1-94 [Tanacetum coccineum]
MRKIISNTSTDSTSQQTRWNKILPSKVNILAWRVLLHRLPTRVNLNHRGIDLDSVRCPLCNDDIETETHVFVNCSLARCIWKDVFSSWQLPNTSITNLDDMFSLPGRVTMESKLKPFSDVELYTVQRSVQRCVQVRYTLTKWYQSQAAINNGRRRLMSVDIKFDDEVQALLLLSSLPESWSGTITTVIGSTGTTKFKFDNIRAESKTDGRSKTEKGYFQNQFPKPVASKDKEVNIAVRDYDDALVCCVENTIEDRIMDYSASFHATFCKEELEKFRLCSGKTLKDVRYILGLKRRLIFVRQLEEEGYHVPSDRINTTIDGRGNITLWHQRLGHMSEKGMKILALNGRIPDLQKAVVGFCEPCVLGKYKKADPATMLPLSMTVVGSSIEFIEYCTENGIRMFKTIPKTPQQNGVAERMNRTLNGRAKRFRIPKEEWQGKEVSLAHLKVFGCDSYVKVKDVARDKLDAKSMKCTFIGYGLDEIRYRFWDLKDHKDQVVLEDSPENLANKSMVTEHGLSSKTTQSPGGSSDTSDGSENSGSFEDSRRSDEEDSED